MAVDVKELWERAMIELVLDFPIYAQLLTRIGTKIIDSPNNRNIAWTDGRAIYINAAMIKEFNENPMVTGDSGKQYNRTIGKKELMFILCHELLHLIGLTFDRGLSVGVYKGAVSDKDIAKWQKWNIATDYEINALLHNNEKTDDRGDVKRHPIGSMPEWVLYESEYMNMAAEDIFSKLPDKKKDPSKPSFDGNFTGNNVDGLDFSLDEHMPIQDDSTRNEVISKMSELFGSTSNGVGSSAIDRIIERAYKPQMFNWRKALTKYIRGWMKDNYSWNKPSRAGIANNLILPSAGRIPKLHIACAVDTSGSISNNELDCMMNHLFTILSQFKNFTVDVWCCGSEVYAGTFRSYNANNKKELSNFEIRSDGGNDMRTNFEFLKTKYKSQKPDIFILLSDFYDPLDGDTETMSPCPCIWMVLDHPNFVPPAKIKAETYYITIDKDKGTW